MVLSFSFNLHHYSISAMSEAKSHRIGEVEMGKE